MVAANLDTKVQACWFKWRVLTVFFLKYCIKHICANNQKAHIFINIDDPPYRSESWTSVKILSEPTDKAMTLVECIIWDVCFSFRTCSHMNITIIILHQRSYLRLHSSWGAVVKSNYGLFHIFRLFQKLYLFLLCYTIIRFLDDSLDKHFRENTFKYFSCCYAQHLLSVRKPGLYLFYWGGNLNTVA